MSNNGGYGDKGNLSFFDSRSEIENNVTNELIFMEDRIRNFIIHNVEKMDSEELRLYKEILELIAMVKNVF